MDYPARFEWQTRCEFNAYCKRTLRNELIDACRERKSRKRHEVSFADLTPQEEKQLYTVDRYFVNEDEEAFCAGGLKITAKLLAEALHSLPDEKRQAVLLYYFFDMTDVEIAELMTVTSSNTYTCITLAGLVVFNGYFYRQIFIVNTECFTIRTMK